MGSTPTSGGTDSAGTVYGSRLFAQHANKLRASGVAVDVAAERDYRTADTKAGMKSLGFGEGQRRPPALLIPLWGVDGGVVGYQCRPDEPRFVKGKGVKYETVSEQRMVLDVHPRVLRHMGDPAVPLVVTEGPIKGDALVSAGACAVAVLGVWSWRGTNDKGGKVALPDWEAVAFNGRRVLIAFDSDVMTKGSVHLAMGRMAGLFTSRGAEVMFAYLPSGPMGRKIGVDDWLVAGHTVDDLWALAKSNLRRAVLEDDGDDEQAEPEDAFDDVPVEAGAVLLDEVAAFFRRFVVFPESHYAEVVALWVLHTHVAWEFDSTPRLSLTSPEPRSGKTRLLEVAELVVARPRRIEHMTAASLFRLVDTVRPTVLADEVDAIFGPKAKEHEDVRSIFNAGHRKGARVPRCVGEGTEMKVVEFDVFAPVALAGIGKLPDTIADRSIILAMRRRAPHEKVEPFRIRRARAEAQPQQRRLAAWGKRHEAELAEAEPVMPDGVTDRSADVWEPLLAIADAAGGEWPKRARDAAVAFANTAGSDEPSRGVRLLSDIRAVFTHNHDPAEMTSADLVAHLVAIEEAPWSDLRGKSLDASGLARRLRLYSIRPSGNVRQGRKVLKHYERDAFTESWDRYLPAAEESDDTHTDRHPQNAATPATSRPPATETPRPTCDVAAVAAVAALAGNGGSPPQTATTIRPAATPPDRSNEPEEEVASWTV
jgi:hypothetical protein